MYLSLRSKNPDLTPLNGMDVGLKAHNKRLSGFRHSAYAQIEAHEEVEQDSRFCSLAKHSFSCASTSHIPGAL